MALTNGTRTTLGVLGAGALVVGVVLGLPHLQAPPLPPAGDDPAIAAAPEAVPPTDVSAPQVPEAEEAQAEPVAAAPALAAPMIDVVRIEPDGTGIVAGQAPAGITVAIMIDNGMVLETVADASGRFVDFLTLPASDKPRLLSLVADPAGAAVPSDQTVVIAPTPVVVAEEIEIASAEDVGTGEAGTGEGQEAEAGEAVQAPAEEQPVAGAVPDAAPEGAPAEIPAADGSAPAEDVASAEGAAAEATAPVEEVSGTEQGVPEGAAPAEEVAGVEGDGAVSAAPGEDVAGAEVGVAEGAAPLEEVAAAASDAAEGAASGEDVVAAEADGTEGATSGAEVAAAEVEAGVPVADVAAAEGDAATAAAPGEEVASAGDVAATAEAASAETSIVAGIDAPAVPDTGAPAAPEVTALAPVLPAAPAEAPAEPAPAATPEADAAPAAPPQLAAAIDVPVAPDATAPAAVAPILMVDAAGVRVLQPARPAEIAPEVLRTVALDAITYDESGDVALAGRATTGGTVRLYLDNAPQGDAPVAADGTWSKVLVDIPPGLYTLRADQIGAEGAVVSRIETPFLREERATIAAVLAEETAAEDFNVAVRTVQPGNTLWAIARERYGQGILYVAVFEANQDLIRDPDLIYPGQIFRLPEIAPEAGE